jgi:hypothetical protein
MFVSPVNELTNEDIRELVEQTFIKLGTRTPTMQEYMQAVNER